ncbi:ABC transporter ATP-binding protein [Eremococcus coleocola]|uniref:ABC transporter, ATP-binding protein n=1 Tax=Eremococcus coleocola ACS-139-V-Col8 TaxID=908337 RepID=E4KPE1_9LACT|nr:ABC transporter, ATP-binding protein [Eremococcus coleocola ACS-139-V-Col8]
MLNSFQKIWPFFKPYRFKLILSIVCVVMTVITNVLEPFVLGLAITEITANVLAMAQGQAGAGLNYRYILMILLLYFLRGLINQLGTYGSNYYVTEAVQAMTRDLRDAIMSKINRLPVSYFDRRQFGDMLGRFTNDVEAIANAAQQAIIQVVNAILSILFVAIMMFILQWQLALIVLISMPLSYAVARAIVKVSQPHFKKQANILGKLNGFVQESLTGFNVIKLFGHEDSSETEFRQITQELFDTGFKASFLSSLMMPLVSVVSHLAYLAVALVGGLLTIAGRLTIGNLQAFTQYVWQVNQPIQMITQLSAMVQSATAAIDRVMEVLEAEEETQAYDQELQQALSGQVSFKDVAFSYSPDKPLIEDFSVEVEPGQTVAIVGPTGAGKTTLINLLMRFYDVNEGSIEVDGIDIRSLSRQEYRKQFGMVLQDAWLYEGSIQDNLRFGNLDASDQDIVAAAKATNVDHFIRTLPGGYHMHMNQESSNISLGQKQLLTIARALLSDPKILILDEATSSVDTRLELLIQKAMDKLMEGRTSFVIAHRLSTIQDADLILVMDQGHIIESGNHASLLAAQGFYYDLYNSQFTSAKD